MNINFAERQEAVSQLQAVGLELAQAEAIAAIVFSALKRSNTDLEDTLAAAAERGAKRAFPKFEPVTEDKLEGAMETLRKEMQVLLGDIKDTLSKQTKWICGTILASIPIIGLAVSFAV